MNELMVKKILYWNQNTLYVQLTILSKNIDFDNFGMQIDATA